VNAEILAEHARRASDPDMDASRRDSEDAELLVPMEMEFADRKYVIMSL
jgi:hypothetical protein